MASVGSTPRQQSQDFNSHCDRGHEWDEMNTYYMPSGTKVCRACNLSTHWAEAGYPNIAEYFRDKQADK